MLRHAISIADEEDGSGGISTNQPFCREIISWLGAAQSVLSDYAAVRANTMRMVE
jgi:hypothetical protein